MWSNEPSRRFRENHSNTWMDWRSSKYLRRIQASLVDGKWCNQTIISTFVSFIVHGFKMSFKFLFNSFILKIIQLFLYFSQNKYHVRYMSNILWSIPTCFPWALPNSVRLKIQVQLWYQCPKLFSLLIPTQTLYLSLTFLTFSFPLLRSFKQVLSIQVYLH